MTASRAPVCAVFAGRAVERRPAIWQYPRREMRRDGGFPHTEGNMNVDHPSRELAAFAAQLRFESIPRPVVERAVNLYVDWLGSALAGKGARPVESIARFARHAGGADGCAEIVIGGGGASAYFAAMVNGAASHFVEQDDVHNGSVLHPATVVFPVVLALAQELGASGRDLITAAVAGYEVGIRIGEFMGRSHYKVFHTTGTAGTLAAAAAAGRLLGLDTARMLDAFGSAGTQAAGLWEFLRDAADSKQLHTAMAAANGLMAARLAADGFRGATHILEGAQGMAAGMSRDADPARLLDRLGERWATMETSFKYHAACRHTHPAADALLSVIAQHALRPEQIDRVTAHVHQGAIDVLGNVVVPRTVHQAKFNMGTVLGIVAHRGYAGVNEFEHGYDAPEIAAFRDKVEMVLDEEVDQAYPQRWIGKVSVATTDGRLLPGRVDEPKGDPGNTLSREEISTKFLRLAAFSGAADSAQARQILAHAWEIAALPVVGSVLMAEQAA
jgi:2-methylcitrate dehydratase PrpD